MQAGNELRLLSSLFNAHECAAPETWKAIIEIDLAAVSDFSKTVIIDLLASVETKAWTCAVVSDHRMNLMPLLKRILNRDTLEGLIEDGSHELRYALAGLAVSAIATNDDLSRTIPALLASTHSLSFTLTWCRRALRFLSRRSDNRCEKCIAATASVNSSHSLLIDLLIEQWSMCLQWLAIPSYDANTIVEILATSSDLITNDATTSAASRLIIDSWSTTGKSILKLITSSNRLIVLHVMDFLYAVFSNLLHDIFASGSGLTGSERVAEDLLATMHLEGTVLALYRAVLSKSWFGGVNEEEGVDVCLVRLLILVPFMALAIAARIAVRQNRSLATGYSLNQLSIPNIDLTDIRQVIPILIEQDDHFCSFFLSCTVLKRYQVACTFDPHEVWLQFLCNIAWSDEVVIDWLASSETTFLVAFVQYLKLIISNPEPLREKAAQFPVATVNCSKSVDEIADIVASPQFSILEIIGNMEKTRTISLKPLRPKKRENMVVSYAINNVWDKFEEFHYRLKSKLERLHRKKLIGFNVQPLLNLLSRINEIK